MPYTIKRDGPTGKPWCVYREGTDERFGCSATRSDAVDMIAAIETGKKKGLSVVVTEEGELYVKDFSTEAAPDEEAQPAPALVGDRKSQEKSNTEETAPMIIAPEVTRYHLMPLEGQPADFAALLKKYQQKSHSPALCMRCHGAPTKAAIWAEGRALAWFCDAHMKEWEQEDERDIVARCGLAEGQDPREWAKARADAQHDKVQEFPVEEVATDCVCPACSKAIPHKRGSPCSERYCPDCGEPLVGSRAKERSLKDLLGDVWKGINRLLGNEEDILDGQEQATEGSFYTYKQADGRHRWVAISSTAFVDRDNEIVSVMALERDVERTPQGERGPLRFWHQKGIAFGDCDFAVVDGLALVESGLWRDDEISTAARQYVEQHPEEFAISIGFLAETKGIEVGTSLNGKAVRAVYNNIVIQERSLLPTMWSSNRFTRIDAGAGGTSNMDKLKREALERLLGVERAATLVQAVDGVNAKATDPGEVFKTVAVGDLSQQIQAVALVLREHSPDDATVLDQAATVLNALIKEPEESPQAKALKALERIEDEGLREELKSYFEALTPTDAPVEEAKPEQAEPAAKQVVDPPPVAPAAPAPAALEPAAVPVGSTPSLESGYGDRLAQLEQYITELKQAPRSANTFPSGRQAPITPAVQKTVSKGDLILDDMANEIFGNGRGES